MLYFLYDEVRSVLYQSSISLIYQVFRPKTLSNVYICIYILSEVLQVCVEYKTQTFFHFALNEQLIDKNYKRMYNVYILIE